MTIPPRAGPPGLRPVGAALLALLGLNAALAAQIPVEPMVELPLLNGAEDIDFVDMDGDGVLDLLTTPATDTFVVVPIESNVLRGLGGASFAPAVQGPGLISQLFGTGDLADLDGDGELDWALPNASDPGQLFIHLGDGSLTFPAPTGFGSSATGSGSAAAKVVDLLGDDDHLDVVVLERAVVFGPAARINAFIADGLGGYSQVVGPEIPSGPNQFALGDLDEDGLVDIVVTSPFIPQAISVYLATSATTWALDTTLTPPGIQASDVELVDVDGDGHLDVVAIDQLSGLVFAPGDGAGGFGATQISPIGASGRGLALGDLDGDGEVDAVLSTIDAVLIAKGSGGGAFELVNSVPAPPTKAVALGDADADGDLDVAVALDIGLLFGLDSVGVLVNRSYPAGSPFTDLGQAHPGSAGLPIHLAEGELLPGTPFAFELFGAVPDGTAFVFVGASAINAPFKGGVLVPAPTLIRARPVDADGAASVAGLWPTPSPSGAQAWVQWWFEDVGASAGVAGSNALRVDVP